ncbi:hypothetical protein [Nocardioides sp.]|uniref:hypothetical protein n=1 Tax=Nocardioides sp. TaxID=35761 RepID=UPI003567F95F
MADSAGLPATSSVVLDARGPDRALRLSWHAEADVVVLSMWRENLCTGTFRLAVDDVPAVIAFLSTGLGAAYVDARAARFAG